MRVGFGVRFTSSVIRFRTTVKVISKDGAVFRPAGKHVPGCIPSLGVTSDDTPQRGQKTGNRGNRFLPAPFDRSDAEQGHEGER